jgi:DNA-binding transcriptional LysR family regulator
MGRNTSNLMNAAVALSENLNFSRAARKLRISQPTLTKQVAALEEWVGVSLFERDRHSVSLNDAGRAFVEHARLSLLHSARAVRAARAAVQESDFILNVGRSPYTDPFLISTLLSLRLPLYPQMRIELASRYSCDQIDDLLAGVLDLAIATEPPDSPLLTRVQIAQSPFYIAMCHDDELADQSFVTFESLASRSWIMFERRLHSPLYDLVMDLAEKRKVVPSKVQHVSTPEEAFPFVSEGSSLAFVVKVGALRIARNGLTVRPLEEDSLVLKTYLASRANEQSKLVSELVRAFMRKASTVARVRQLPLLLSN